MCYHFILPLSLTLLIANSASFADIPSWRTNQNGVYATDVSPVNWREKLLFEIPLENKSNATPILVEDKLIFTAEPAWLICADSKTGKVIWERSNDLMELNNISDSKRQALEAHKARIETVEREIRRLRNDVRRLERAFENDEENQRVKASLNQKYEESSRLNKESEALQRDPDFSNFVTPPAHNTNGYSS